MKDNFKAAGKSLLLGLTASLTVWTMMAAYGYWRWCLIFSGGGIGIRI